MPFILYLFFYCRNIYILKSIYIQERFYIKLEKIVNTLDKLDKCTNNKKNLYSNIFMYKWNSYINRRVRLMTRGLIGGD
jgi:hypothetical protein